MILSFAPVAPGALQRLATEPQTVADMGRKARDMLDARFTRMQALERWRKLLDGL